MSVPVHVEGFNRAIKLLATKLVELHPKDPQIQRAKKKIYVGIDVTPTVLIDAVGPYLYSCREQIMAGDYNFFLETQDYQTEVANIAGHNAEQADLIMDIIPKVKAAWKASDAGLQEQYLRLVQDLLDHYVDYRLAIETQKLQ